MAAPSRIITLTPHATELVFAAGAGAQIVGTVQSSDYPERALTITRVGDGLSTSLEQVIALEPDWVIGWPSALLSQLGTLGIRTMTSSPESLEDIGRSVITLGKMFGTDTQAQAWYTRFSQDIERLDDFVATDQSQIVNIVVLASNDGQFVIGRHALINDTLKRCGATNPFAQTQAPAPLVSPESLIAAKPDVIISGRPLENPLPTMLTVPLAVIDADSLYRPGPRFINAARQICMLADQVRHKRSQQRTIQ
ncbi:helical backbone metal receptor [Orrella daihaiensis]|uniref:ABC transporter substrate-binding protein n=1 Tax=Orrella daihaiensis TaxID=2782176 RepID=A0ABY4AK84_9BURK|nr:helical backbone metal receptor [Orrella daihaiensis]UOD50682.1 ABC transporter substrate-binding protein [Orrella daihaiensis]